MKYKLFIMLSLIMYSHTACSPKPAQEPEQPQADSEILEIDNPYAPQSKDDEMLTKKAFLSEVSWDGENNTLWLKGDLPTPCNELRVESAHNNDILVVNVYSVYPPDAICAQLLEPFEATLTIKSIPQEITSFLVNEQTIEIQNN